MSIMRSIKKVATQAFDAVDARFPGNAREERGNDVSIRLFWWNAVPNFGDALSEDVVCWIAGCDVDHAPVAECNMIAIGSIYAWLKTSLRRRGRVVHVWGSGTLMPESGLWADSGLVLDAVRGPLTAWATGRDVPVIGDPGLLADRVFGVQRSASPGRPGLVLNHEQSEKADQRLLKSLSDRFEIIDTRNSNAREVVEQISLCSSVFSSSLHGLVVADALNIPNILVAPGNSTGARLNRGLYKFVDYALAIDRVLNVPVEFADLARAPEPEDMPAYFNGLERVKDGLVNAFPARWRAAATAGGAAAVQLNKKRA